MVFPSLSEFSIVCGDPHCQRQAEVDIFLELSCFFDNPVDVGNLISGSSAFSKASLNIRKFMVHVLLRPGLENFEHYFTSVWDECNCAVVWAFFGIAFLWDWNENGPSPVLWPLLSFPNLLAHLVQICWHLLWGMSFQILKDDAVLTYWVLHSICWQIWKTQQWPQDWRRSVFIPIPKKGNAKEY